MSIKVEGLEDLEALFLTIEAEGPRRVVKKMIEGGKQIQELAVKMAPVDHGYLEESIKLDISNERDSLGRFATRVVTVFVDQEMQAQGAKVVGDYAYYIHEHQTPMGPVPLGPKSQIKQAGQSVIVGGGFLERAAQEIEEKIQGEVSQTLRDYLK